MRVKAAGFLAVCLSLLVGGCQPESVTRGGEEAPSTAVHAMRMRYQQRLSEDGTVPENALMIAKGQRDAMLEAQGQMDGGGLFPASWTWVGPGNIGGRLRAIIIHPTQPNTIWVGTVGGGIWKTTDGGATWAPLDEFMATVSVGCMAITPSNPDILYAGTGEGFFESVEGSSNTAAILGVGVFKSTDGGLTWNQLPSTASWPYVNRLAVDPSDPNKLWAATKLGIFKSLDAGTTWTLKSAGDFLDLRLDPADPLKLLAAKSHAGVFHSTDGGETWTASTGVAGHRVELSYAPSNPSIVYGAQMNNDQVTIYQSTDGGQTFSLRGGAGISGYEIYNVALWVDPTNPNRIIYGGVNLYRSTDGGNTRSQVFTGVHADMHVIETAPGFDGVTNKTIYVGCDGGIYRITDAYGTGQTRINNNLGVTQFYGAAIHDGTGVVLAGAQDNGTSRYTGNPLVWNENVIGGDGAYCASDPTNSQVWYGATQYNAIRRSTNGGTSFSSVAPPGAGSANNYNFIPYFMLDPNQSNRMLACGEFLYRSNNIRTGAPPTWSNIKPSIRTGGKPGTGGDGSRDGQAHFADNNPWNISTCAVAQGNSNLIWVGHNNGSLYKTVNGTAATPTWTKMDTNPPGLPDRWISRIVIDPANHNRVYVSFLGWASNNVWRTVDGGLTWQLITGSGAFALPAVPVGAFAQHRTKPGWLYAGTDLGIFTSSDDGVTWTTFTDGPGTVPIDELVWRNNNVLMAVTHGRGVYLGTVDPNIEPFSPRSVVVTEGTMLSGRVQELYYSDNQYIVAKCAATSQLTVEMEGVSPIAAPATMKLSVESRVLLPGGFHIIDLFDFTTSQWVRAGTLFGNTSDTTELVTGPGAGGNYVEPGTRKVRARMIYTATRSAPRTWTANLDQVYWQAIP